MDQLRQAVDQLTDHAAFLQTFRQGDGKATFVSWYPPKSLITNKPTSDLLDADLLARMGALGLSLSLNVLA